MGFGQKITLAILIGFLVPPAVFAQTTEEMLSSCKGLIDAKIESNVTIQAPHDFDTGVCVGTFSALWWMGSLRAVETGEQNFLPGLCLPKGATTTQLIAVFATYAKQRPELYSQQALKVALEALWHAFPCKVPPVK